MSQFWSQSSFLRNRRQEAGQVLLADPFAVPKTWVEPQLARLRPAEWENLVSDLLDLKASTLTREAESMPESVSQNSPERGENKRYLALAHIFGAGFMDSLNA